MKPPRLWRNYNWIVTVYVILIILLAVMLSWK